MRRLAVPVCAVFCALALCACGGGRHGWSFAVDTVPKEEETYAGETVMTYSFIELPELRLEAEKRASAEPPEAMAAARDAFNAAMAHERAMYAAEIYDMDQLARDRYAAGSEGFGPFRPLGQSLRVAELRQTERLVSVRAEGASGWGGNHPWHAVRTWSFDLDGGVFVDWADLAREPNELREALAAEVLRQIGERGTETYFDGYAARVERLEGCSVYLGEEGMTLLFDEGLLGPRALGVPSFTVPYRQLSDQLNSYAKNLIK